MDLEAEVEAWLEEVAERWAKTLRRLRVFVGRSVGIALLALTEDEDGATETEEVLRVRTSRKEVPRKVKELILEKAKAFAQREGLPLEGEGLWEEGVA